MSSADVVSLSYGCVELVNPLRTAAYVANFTADPDLFDLSYPPSVGWQALEVGCDCAVLGFHDEGHGVTPAAVSPYVSPILDFAPWYSAVHPESNGFLGFVVDSTSGFAEVAGKRSVTPRATTSGGSTLAAHRKTGRCFEVSLFAFAVNEQAMKYGLRWLTDKLTFNCGDDCSLCDLEIRTSCPEWSGEFPTYAQFDMDRWVLPDTGLVEGPTLLDPPVKNLGCNVRRINFSMCSQSPWMTKCPHTIATTTLAGKSEVRVHVEASSSLGEDGMIIEIDAPDKDVTNLSITVQEDFFGYVSDPGSAPSDWVDPPPCGFISIPIVPQGNKLIYDTGREEIKLQLGGGQIKEGSSLVSATPGSPPTFPTLRCGTFAVRLAFDNVATTSATVSLSTVHRELIG